MFSVRWDSGLLKSLGQSLTAVLVAATFVLIPPSAPQAQAAGVLADGSNSVVDYSIFLDGVTISPAISANGEYLKTATSTGLRGSNTSLMIEAWVKPESVSTQNVVFAKDRSFLLRASSNGWILDSANGTSWGQQDYGPPVQLNQWSHVAVVVTSSEHKLYVNGALVATAPSGGHNDNSQVFSVGAYFDGNAPFHGEIDEVKIWVNKVGADIPTTMHTRASPSDSDLQAYWDFNETSGTTVVNRKSGSPDLIHQGNPNRVDVKQVTSVAGGDTVITFPRTYLPGVGGWTVPKGVTSAVALIVGGGGAGGSTYDAIGAGGGGAGGFIESEVQLTPGTMLAVQVGQGGSKQTIAVGGYLASHGRSGQSSTFSNLTAFGGGGGSGRSGQGLPGGSGGGTGGRNSFPGGQPFDPDQGNAGGGSDNNSTTPTGGGGGGGASSAGQSVALSTRTDGGAGGAGASSVVMSGTFAEGGSGGSADEILAGLDGVANTGNGGSGASASQTNSVNDVEGVSGGSGGSGVVAVRYTPTNDNAFSVGANETVTGTDIFPTASNVAFSAEAWVYPTDLTGWRGILNQSPSLRDGLQRTFLGTLDGVINFGVNAGSFINTGYTIQANQWTHIAVVVSGSGASGVVDIYVNGQLISNTTSYNRATTTGSVFHLGGTHVTSEYWMGQIDQVKIWQGALSAGDVAKSMHTYSSSGIASAALQSLYDFNEFNQGVELNRVTNQPSLSVTSSVTATNYTASAILETGNASSQDVYIKFKRSYLTANGGWSPVSGISRYKALVVGGGGGGGAWVGGGGGAGGFTESPSIDLNGAIPVQVGQAGLAAAFNGTSFAQTASPGQTSSIGSGIVATGGGYGGSHTGGTAIAGIAFPSTGASGGGGTGRQGGNLAYSTAYLGASGTSGLGSSGGNGSTADWVAGGGGGAGQAGAHATGTSGGDGGAGIQSSITGAQTYYAGGGGGARFAYSAGQGQGGSGGGGDAGYSSTHGTPGEANSGGGGGGGASATSTTGSSGGAGGSGVVILSYNLAPDAPTSLVATQTTTHATIDLSWTAPTYTGNSSITGYDIEYKPAGGSWTSHSSIASSPASVQLPQQCIAHDFRVIAKNTNFSSVASATASATPVWGTFGSLTGVQISSTNSECVVKFTSTASATTWTPPAGTDTVRALVVAGGGGGGAWVGAGGGAGGFTESSHLVVPSSALTIEVGGGGAGGTRASNTSTPATNGSPSSISAIGQPFLSALGGGAGASWDNLAHGAGSGGSGGGGNGTFTAGLGADGQGFQGGRGDTTTLNTQYSTGGGGGAGGPGEDGIIGYSGDGGPGKASDITGVSVYYAGGGGGGYHGDNNSDPGPVYHPDSAGSGGIGGGGDGGQPTSSGAASTAYASSDPSTGQNGQANTGGGGGGAGKTGNRNSFGGSGGSGVIILRQLSVAGPSITSHPQNQSAEPSQTKTLTVTATGNGTLSYQWQSSTDGSGWTNVGTNASSFTTGTLALSDNGIQYRVIVTNTLNGQNSVVTSNVAVISVVGVTIGSGLCETMVSNDSGATVSQTAAGGCLLEFTTPGNNMWFVPNNVSSVEALVVGGGGGGAGGRGGSWYGGGGGGGGAEYVKVSLAVTTSQQIPLVVGAGGSPGGNNQNGASGENSSFSVSSAVATGGSGGLASTALSTGGSGGSGGLGSGVGGSRGGDGADGLASRTFQRPTAGSAANSTVLGGEQFCLGGGGGGGNRGVDNTPHFYFQAQGGGCSALGLSSGGAGRYFNGSSYLGANPGVANSGGGGGGGSYISGGGSAGAAGGSGLVALYFVPGAGDITLSQPDAMSYSSTANTTSITLSKTSPGSAAWTTSNQTICTVTGNDSGATVTVLTAGVCAVSVTVGAAGGYSTGSAEVSFRIDRTTQPAPTWDAATATVAFGGTVDLYEKLNDPGLAANYTFTVSGTGCSVTGLVLTVGNAGSNCVVTPTLNETNKYLASSGTNFTVSVTKISQSSLVLTSATSMNVDQTLTLSAAGGTGDGALTYHVLSSGNSASCVIANSSTGVLDPSSAGSCEVYAKRASSTNYDEVTSSHVVITVNKISQNLSWVSQPQAQYQAGQVYVLEATASSQLAVAYSVSSGLCEIQSQDEILFTGSGDCVIHAGQSGNSSYLEAVTISQTVSVGKINQTMTFSALADKSWGSLAFSLSATASSGLNIAYTENNQTTNDACDVSTNGIVTIKNVGTCAITSTQAGNSAYTAVTTTRLFEVTANQAGAPFIGSVSFGDRQLNASFFTPSYLGGGTVSAYELQAHPLGGGAVVRNTGCIPQQGPNQTCSVVGLTNGVTYELKVAAITQAGLGQLSASSSEVTPASNPEAVGNLVAIEGNGTLTLQWTPPTNLGGGAFDQYRIYWKAPGGSYQANGSPGASIGTQASTSFVITGLQNGTSYDVKVITTTGVNTAELQSNTAEVRQTPYTVPDAPAAIVAIDNDNNVVVAWQAPVFDGGNPIDQYVVEKDGTTVCTITSATTTSCEVEKPSAGNTSLIEVRAGNDAGLSDPVSTSITVAALPGSTAPGLIAGGGFPGVTPGATAPIVLDVSGSAVVKTNGLVRLSGTNFNLVEKVLIGDVEASFFVNNAQLITIRIPVGVSAGKPTITLQGAFGSRIFAGLIEVSLTQVSIDTKVTIGTFLGYAAVYTKNHEGKRLSMKIGNKWRVIESLGGNYTYNYTKVGVGKTVTVEVYIDRVLVQVKQIKIQ